MDDTMLIMGERGLSSRDAEHLRNLPLTYRQVGSTRDTTMPRGYRALCRTLGVGTGEERLELAAQVLLSWDMHRRAGLGVRTSSARVTQGAVAVLSLGFGNMGVQAPVRVVYMVDEPRRKGFAYGTLAGHPESGEEAFVLELQDDDAVTFTITGFSRPAMLLSRVGGPISRAIQSRITNRYLRAL